MTNTIKVPVDLIISGDITALRELLPASKSLLGRWAEHPQLGRGMVCSAWPNENGFVRFAYKNERFTDGTDWGSVRFDDLTLDPVELTTAEDYDNAPEGTIVEDCFAPNDKHTGVTWQKQKMDVGDVLERHIMILCPVLRALYSVTDGASNHVSQ